jgi:hypothetical protein
MLAGITHSEAGQTDSRVVASLGSFCHQHQEEWDRLIELMVHPPADRSAGSARWLIGVFQEMRERLSGCHEQTPVLHHLTDTMVKAIADQRRRVESLRGAVAPLAHHIIPRHQDIPIEEYSVENANGVARKLRNFQPIPRRLRRLPTVRRPRRPLWRQSPVGIGLALVGLLAVGALNLQQRTSEAPVIQSLQTPTTVAAPPTSVQRTPASPPPKVASRKNTAQQKSTKSAERKPTKQRRRVAKSPSLAQ